MVSARNTVWKVKEKLFFEVIAVAISDANNKNRKYALSPKIL